MRRPSQWQRLISRVVGAMMLLSLLGIGLLTQPEPVGATANGDPLYTGGCPTATYGSTSYPAASGQGTNNAADIHKVYDSYTSSTWVTDWSTSTTYGEITLDLGADSGSLNRSLGCIQFYNRWVTDQVISVWYGTMYPDNGGYISETLMFESTPIPGAKDTWTHWRGPCVTDANGNCTGPRTTTFQIRTLRIGYTRTGQYQYRLGNLGDLRWFPRS